MSDSPFMAQLLRLFGALLLGVIIHEVVVCLINGQRRYR